jgi:hypothetical protein
MQTADRNAVPEKVQENKQIGDEKSGCRLPGATNSCRDPTWRHIFVTLAPSNLLNRRIR